MTVIERRAPRTTITDRDHITVINGKESTTVARMPTAPFTAVKRPDAHTNGKKHVDSKAGDATDSIVIW
jgi:hypothetical protein